MKRRYQRYNNDCAIAAVSMASDLPYRQVLKTAKSRGFKPNKKGQGFYIHILLDLLGLSYQETADIEDEYVEGPAIFLFPANDGSEEWHCAVVYKGKVYDPSICRPVSLGYVIKTASFMYSEIRSNEE